MSNRYLAAFQENFNVLGLASTAALAMALTHPLPILIGVVAEATYLIFVPDSKWYSARLAKIHDAEVQAKRDEIKAKTLPLLRPQLKDRFLKLEEVRRDIDGQTASDLLWMREILRKLDFLLEQFLNFAVKEGQFRDYLEVARDETQSALRNPDGPYRGRPLQSQNDKTPPRLSPDGAWIRDTVDLVQGSYEKEVVSIQTQFEAESDESTRAILTKRIAVLQRRREFIGRIGKIVVNLNHQLSLVEDTFGLINDELVARPPEQVLADIEDVVSQTNAMTQALEELAPYEKVLATL